ILRPLHVIASAAKQSILSSCGGMDCFAALAMTADTVSHSRGAMRPRFAETLRPLEIRGRRECRVRAAPAVSCAFVVANAHTSIQGSGEHPTFPAQWLYGLYRALPGERLFCLRGALKAVASRCIDASTATSGPHVFAVRFSRARQLQLWRPPHPRPTFVTIMIRPSGRDGMGVDIGLIWVSDKAKYF